MNYKSSLVFYALIFAFKITFAQNSINDYKYVIVPYQFSFLAEKDQYRLNSQLRQLFKNKNFNTYFDVQELPEDLFANRCLAMYADVNKIKAFLSTKLQVVLKDCRGEVILRSEEGSSKEKEYKKSYKEALEKAFFSLELENYSYRPMSNVSQDIINSKQTKSLQALQEEIEVLKAEKQQLVKRSLEKTPEIKAQQKDVSVIPNKPEPKNKTKINNVLFAQPITNGFQLVDTSPRVVMKIYDTGKDDVFMVNDYQSIVLRIGDKWYISKATTEGVERTELHIKF